MQEKDKQIEEMAKDLCHTETCEIKKIGIPCNHRCKAHIYATRAIDKGYRKASDVAEEIIAIIEQRISTNTERKKGLQSTIWQAHYEGCLQAYTDIKEIIEQKYTEN